MADLQPSTPLKTYTQKAALLRLRYAIRIRILKALTTVFFRVLSLPGIRNSSILPTFTKAYPCRPTLTNRVFIPKLYKTGDILPLYLDIHGGGFAIMDPSSDDKFCSEFSNQNKVLMVSINYPKSPANPYPAGVQAVTALVKAILEDDALPFDKSKVAIGGFSAGANFALSVSQDESLQNRIGGVVAYYPPTNWTTSLQEKLASRPKNAPPDPLESNGPAFDWAYLPPGTNLEDPRRCWGTPCFPIYDCPNMFCHFSRNFAGPFPKTTLGEQMLIPRGLELSVAFAPRDKLPQKLYIIGCELDLLCRDAELMAERLANIGTGQRVGTDSVWEKNGVKWENILGEEHGE